MQSDTVVRMQTRYQLEIHQWLACRAKRNNRSMNGELMYVLKKVKEVEERKTNTTA